MRMTCWLASLGLLCGGLALAQEPTESLKGTRPAPAPKPVPTEAPKAARPAPILFPTIPFPPSSPPVQDPRTGGWQQVRGGADEAGERAPSPSLGRNRPLLQKVCDHFRRKPLVGAPGATPASEEGGGTGPRCKLIFDFSAPAVSEFAVTPEG